MPQAAQRNPVAKALKVLKWMIEAPNEQVGVRRLAAQLEIPASNAHSLLATLVSEGLVYKDPATSSYSLGAELSRLAHLVVARAPLERTAMQHLKTLVATCNETALLGIFDAGRNEMMFAACIDSGHPLRYAIELHKWLPLGLSASSSAIAAHLDEEVIQRIFDVASSRLNLAGGMRSFARYKRELAAVREQGYAFSSGERTQGAVGIGAPIFGANGAIVGDVVLTIPEQRFRKGDLPRLARALKQSAKAITEDLGGRTD